MYVYMYSMSTTATQFEKDVWQLVTEYAAQESQIRNSTPYVVLLGAPDKLTAIRTPVEFIPVFASIGKN